MKKNYCIRAVQMVISVLVMGAAVSFLLMTSWGTDPWTTVNNGLSMRTGISFGTCQLTTNIILLIVVFFRERSLLGLGTFVNMILVGYSADFTTWMVEKLFGTLQFNGGLSKIIVIVPALIVFVLAAGIYMNSDLGTAPYDAFSILIHNRLCRITGKSIKFRVVRMIYDGVISLIGFLIGGKAGVVTLGIILTLGPAVDFVGYLLKKHKQ